MPRSVVQHERPVVGGSLNDVVITRSDAGVHKIVTADNFKIALSETLLRSNLFGSDAAKGYRLEAHLTAVELPGFGATMTSTISAQYRLINSAGDKLLDREISGTGTAGIGDEFFGSARALRSFQDAKQDHFAKVIAAIQESLAASEPDESKHP
jgi:hypothetical protein